MQEIHVDQHVVGWSAGRHVDHPCGGGQISPWPARKVIDKNWPKLAKTRRKLAKKGRFHFTVTDLFSRVCFRASFFSFLPLLLATPLPPLFSAPFCPFLPLKSALFCREKGTEQSLERGSFRTDLFPKFGKEIPSRNLLRIDTKISYGESSL